VPDVVVVGGGIIGVACADELTRRGASVMLIERDELAAGASGRNQGLWVPPEDPALQLMAERSLLRYFRVADEAPLPVWIDPRPIGTVYVAVDGDAFQATRDVIERLSPAKPKIEELDRARLSELEPEIGGEVAGAWLVDAGHRLDPAALTVALALLAASRGATIRHHLSVRALRTSRDRVTGVVTDEGVIGADEVVVAAGPWSPRLLDPIGIRLPVIGVRGWLVRVEPERSIVRHLIRTVERSPDRIERPTVGEVARDGLPVSDDYGSIVHPHVDGTVLMGSSRAAWLTPEPEDPEVPRRILAEAIRVIPRLSDASVVSSWWGLRPMTPDERPLIGRVRDGLVVATGHGSEGVINGAGTAELVAATALGHEMPFDAFGFDPFRFGAAD
jgi:glycine/D-amino acid oxidase-like deaminating enzyme